MTAQEAYRAGFMLKCASLGLPSSFSQALFGQKPKVIKKALLGSILGGAYNLGAGGVTLSNDLIQGAGGLGKAVGQPSSPKLPSVLSDEAIQNLLMAAHYRRARQALLQAKEPQVA